MLAAIIVSYLIGSVESKMKPFIVGGNNATSRHFAYAACLHILCKDTVNIHARSWRCGSSIVNQHILLTAAHCVAPVICGDVAIAVTVGNSNRLKGTIRSAVRYWIHENYKSDLSNDIALVKLKHPLRFSQTISRVAIMPYPPYKEPAEVAGWGRTDAAKMKLTNDLQYTCYTALEEKPCLDILGKMPEGTFCARKTGQGYIFNGDSGSALVVKGYIQIGISSYVKVGSIDRVAVFSDVGYYYNWIRKHTEDLLCHK